MLPIGVHSEAEALLCPIRTVLSKVTGKWQMIIVLALEDGPLRFGVLKRTIGDVTQGVLTENLRSLQKDGYLTRTVDPGPPIAVSYALTPLGQALVKLLKHLFFGRMTIWMWSKTHGTNTKTKSVSRPREQLCSC